MHIIIVTTIPEIMILYSVDYYSSLRTQIIKSVDYESIKTIYWLHKVNDHRSLACVEYID